jgi:hypothetical protein
LQPLAFFGPPARAWEFGAGALAGFVPTSLISRFSGISRLMGWAGLAAIGGSAFTFTRMLSFPGLLAVVPVIGTVAVLVAGVGAPGAGVARILAWAPLQRMGQLSYSWYLWHWPVLAYATALAPAMSLAGRIGMAMCALVLAQATYWLVESPLRSMPSLVARPKLSLAMAVGLTCAGLMVSALAAQHASTVSKTPHHEPIAAAVGDLSPITDGGCFLGFRHVQPNGCVFGDGGSPKTVVLFGDSHANHWFPAVEAVANARGWRLVTHLKAACPAADAGIYATTLKREYVECTEWRRKALNEIVALRPAAVVIANSSGTVEGVWRTEEPPPNVLSYKAWKDANRRTLTVLDAAKIPVMVLRDAPRLGFDTPRCLSRAEYRGQPYDVACSRRRETAIDDGVWRVEREAADGLARISFLDLSDRFCSSSMCLSVRDGLVVFSDSHHMTATFARSLAPAIDDPLAAIVDGAVQ